MAFELNSNYSKQSTIESNFILYDNIQLLMILVLFFFMDQTALKNSVSLFGIYLGQWVLS